MHYGVTDTAEWLNSNGFTNVQSLVHWSSTTSNANTSNAWFLDLANGYMDLTASKGTSRYVLPVRTAGSFPDISVTDSVAPGNDSQIPFGNRTEGTTADQTVTVTNNGSANLVIGTIAGADPLGAPFSITADTCSGMTLAPSAVCTVTVRFAPVSPGAFNDSFDVPSNDPDTASVTLAVNGTGLPGAVNNAPGAPTLVYPADGQTGLGSTVRFRWKRSTDPDNDPITYHLYACTDPNFTNCDPVDTASNKAGRPYLAGIGMFGGLGMIGVVFGGSRRGRKALHLAIVVVLLFTGLTLASCGGNDDNPPAFLADEVTYAESGLTSGVTYYWKVAADDGKGGTAESAVRSFRTN
jgi:hypothetical protein